MNDWNPQQYLKFKNERTRPTIDLVARIPLKRPKKIIDIGCGPGNSTQILYNRWPSADILGVDSSRKMIEKARADYPDQKWEIRDASNLDSLQKYDIVFSSSTLQWLSNHDLLIPRLFEMVNKNGILAVQIVNNNESPIYKILLRLAKSDPWQQFTSDCEELQYCHSAEYYYSKLSLLTQYIDLWETMYYHIMQSHRDLVEWQKYTGMRPFLERLPDDTVREKFEKEILKECIANYPIQSDGRVLFIIKRLFFVARKS